MIATSTIQIYHLLNSWKLYTHYIKLINIVKCVESLVIFLSYFHLSYPLSNIKIVHKNTNNNQQSFELKRGLHIRQGRYNPQKDKISKVVLSKYQVKILIFKICQNSELRLEGCLEVPARRVSKSPLQISFMIVIKRFTSVTTCLSLVHFLFFNFSLCLK